MFRVIDDGKNAVVEIDGKTIGCGVERIKYKRDGATGGNLQLVLSLDHFEFLPDGYFDEVEARMRQEKKPHQKTVEASTDGAGESGDPATVQ